MRHLLALLVLLLGAPSLASAVSINFDDTSAPCLFNQQTPLTNRYAGQGVTFSGGGWEVLNQCGSFGISGHSSPNFLAFNFGTGGISRTETLSFSSGAGNVSFRIGSSQSFTNVTARAYNGSGSLLETQSRSLSSSSLQTISFSSSGIRSIQVEVTSGNTGGFDDLNFTLNTPPNANAGGPYTVGQGGSVALNGSGSSDPGGSITLYEWDCTNNGSYDTSSSSSTGSSCSYPNAGNYTVRLRVTDNQGASDTDTASVTVTNTSPVANAGGPYTVNQGLALGLNGSGSFDPDGSISQYSWDCTNNGSYDVNSGSPTGSTCTYPDDGQYTVRLRVTDDDGATATATASVTVTNTGPSANAGGPYSVNQGVPLTPNGGSSSDPDGTLVLYEWDCTNNGSYDVSSSSSTGSTCTYPDDGSYVIRLRVTDDDGATATATANVTAVNTPPTADAGGPYSVNQASSVSLNGSGSLDPDGTISLYEWDCTNNGSYDVSSTSPTANVCSYSGAGSYTVRVRVTDDDGATATDVANVTVTNLPPTADAGGPYSVSQGDALALVGTGSTDPDGTIVSYEWDCTNNGSFDTSSTNPTGSTCTYAAQGTFTVLLRVTDSDGAQDTDTAVVTVTNALPVADAGGPYTVNQGVSLALDGSGSFDPDGSITQYEWDCTSDGVYETTSANPFSTCTYPDDGSFTVTLRVTDDDGDTTTDSAAVVVTNTLPVAEAGGPYSGSKSFPVALNGSVSSDADGAIVSFEWDCMSDGAFELSSSVGTGDSCTYPAVGSYTVALRVTDDDGGQSTDTATVTIANDDPIAVAAGPYSGLEEQGIAVDGSGSSDPGGAVVLYEWDCEGDGLYEYASASSSATCTYGDDGNYTLVLRVTDDDGATVTDSTLVSVGNIDPVIASVTVVGGLEGETLSFAVSASDVVADPLTATWDFGDGIVTTGATPTHTYADDGTYTVTVTVTDGDGGVAVSGGTAVISNVDPVLTTSPPVNALQGSVYSYAPSVVDPGDEVFGWTLSASAPAGMTVDGATGLIQWTPSYDQALVGSFSVVLTVNDGDGGSDAQSWTITVLSLDTDGDGLPDSWELDNGLDPNDPTDALGDPDGDGMTNLDEFGQGTDPNVYDGPSVPVAFAPLTGDEVFTDRPDLVVDNAIDPQGEVLVYDFEVYSDAALTVLVTSASDVIETPTQTEWKVDVPLAENQMYWWRARAADSWIATDWTPEESFVVNEVQEEPSAPVLVYPTGGETVPTLTPVLVWTESVDPDGDAVTYDIEVFDAVGALVDSATGVVGDGAEGSWTLSVGLVEDSEYFWTARGVDEHGFAGPWALEESFFLSTANAAPFGTVFLSPEDGQELDSQSPTLVASESEDPEGSELVYEFELDLVASFDSADLRTATHSGTGTGTVEWALAADGIVLPANTLVYARVRAVDAGGVASVPDTISFFVRGENDAPSVPVLVAPADGSEGSNAPRFEVEDPTDPEGDVTRVEFIVARDPELTEIIVWNEGGVIVTGTGMTSWQSGQTFSGTVYWSARSIDAHGATSAWAEAWTYDVDGGAGVGDDDDSANTDPEGCACASSVGGEGASPWMLLLGLLALPVVRRRR